MHTGYCMLVGFTEITFLHKSLWKVMSLNFLVLKTSKLLKCRWSDRVLVSPTSPCPVTVQISPLITLHLWQQECQVETYAFPHRISSSGFLILYPAVDPNLFRSPLSPSQIPDWKTWCVNFIPCLVKRCFLLVLGKGFEVFECLSCPLPAVGRSPGVLPAVAQLFLA